MDDDAELATKAAALVAWASGLLGTDGTYRHDAGDDR